MEILNSLEEIFKDIFDDEELKLERETSADDIDDWDSLAQINLIVAIEKEFNVKNDAIARVCRNERNHTKGYHFEYVNTIE